MSSPKIVYDAKRYKNRKEVQEQEAEELLNGGQRRT